MQLHARRRGHGTDGWPETNRADAKLAVGDSKIRKILVSAIATLTPDGGGILGRLGELVDDVQGLVNVLTKDPNTLIRTAMRPRASSTFPWRPRATESATARATTSFARWIATSSSAIASAASRCAPTRFDPHPLDDAREGGKLRASGVEVLPGSRLYGAAPGSKSAQSTGAHPVHGARRRRGHRLGRRLQHPAAPHAERRAWPSTSARSARRPST
ncbi:MAG: hypothetical protein U0235_13385 [Polyangiaceae bacterium]